jgi:hypothetical protein
MVSVKLGRAGLRGSFYYIICGYRLVRSKTLNEPTTSKSCSFIVHPVKEAVWLRSMLDQLKPGDYQAIVIHYDNQGAIALAKNPENHARSKHIAIQEHFVREKVQSGEVELQYVPTEKQVADGLAEALLKVPFLAFYKALGLKSVV